MVGHSFQNYDIVYVGFSAEYTCLYLLRTGFYPIYTTISIAYIRVFEDAYICLTNTAYICVIKTRIYAYLQRPTYTRVYMPVYPGFGSCWYKLARKVFVPALQQRSFWGLFLAF